MFLSDIPHNTHMVSVLCVYSVSVYAYRVGLGWMDAIFCDCLTNTQSHEHCPQPWEISAHQPPLRWLFIPLSLTPSSSLTLSILFSFTLSSCASGFHSMNVTQCLSLCKIGLLGSITDVSLPDFRALKARDMIWQTSGPVECYQRGMTTINCFWCAETSTTEVMSLIVFKTWTYRTHVYLLCSWASFYSINRSNIYTR